VYPTFYNGGMECDWMQLAGRFLVFDGPDGSGKSTQFSRFAGLCREEGLVVCEVREPGGTAIGEQIREVLLDPENTDMAMRTEMLLYMASRGQLVEQTIRPALQRGELVLADRFISSTLAYQGTAGGLAVADILAVGRVAVGECWPHLTVIFDVDEQVAAGRLNPLLDRMELKGAEFHRRVRQGYMDLAAGDPAGNMVIDASGSEDEVFELLVGGLGERFCAEEEGVRVEVGHGV